MGLMANIFRHVTISEEIAHIGTVAPVSTVIKKEDKIAEDQVIWQSGYTQGLSDGMSQERALLNEQTNTLTSLLQSIPQAINENRQQLSSDIADIVLLITGKLFIHQQQNKEAITHQITQVIMQLNEKQNLEIVLHPHDLAMIQEGEIKVDLRSCKNLRFKADDNLRLGGCIVNSEHGVFDAGIERQIDNLKQVLLQMRSDS